MKDFLYIIIQLAKDISQIKKDLLNFARAGPRPGSLLLGKEVCKRLQISSGTLASYRRQKILPYTRIGRKIYYKAEDLEKLLADNFYHQNKKQHGNKQQH